MIAIIDYGVGNLFFLKSSLGRVGAEAAVTGDEQALQKAEKLILPGVGAFGDARERLAQTGLDEVICREASRGKAILGICLGMQLLFERSFEYGEHSGLGLIPGEVVDMAPRLPQGLKVPHIGWNAMDIVPGREADPLFKYVKNGEYVYYVHSYYAKNCAASTLATSDYSIPVTGAVRQGLVYGTQFHPEKSGDTGLRLLKAFAEL